MEGVVGGAVGGGEEGTGTGRGPVGHLYFYGVVHTGAVRRVLGAHPVQLLVLPGGLRDHAIKVVLL